MPTSRPNNRPPSRDQTTSNAAPFDALETQRNLIAGEIHDSLLPTLFAAASCLAAAQRQANHGSDALVQAARWLDQSREIARGLLSELVLPEAVIENPVAAAKSWTESLRGASSQEELNVEIVWSDIELAGQRRWSNDQATAVYRIVTELVQNAVRHSGATSIDINIRLTKARLTIEVSDNGRGMTPAVDSTDSFGQRLIRWRAEQAGIQVAMTPRHSGTSFEINVPRS